MIEYEIDKSPFFIANKDYCESIENKLKELKLDFVGYCNSFGYEIETSFKRDNLDYNFKCIKYQSTQNGVIIPVNALDYYGTEMNVSGLNKKIKFVIDRNKFKRLFISNNLKNKIPYPYYISFNYSPDIEFQNNIIKQICDYKISKLNLNYGKLKLIMRISIEDPIGFILNFEKIISFWK